MELITPKVYAPYVTPSGQVPRRVLIERKRRLFTSQQLEKLLHERGVFYNEPSQSDLAPFVPPSEDWTSPCVLARFLKHHPKIKRYLPLELFDDLLFEERTPEEYVSLSISPKNSQEKYLPVQALRLNSASNLYEWVQGKVLSSSLDPSFTYFDVVFNDTSSSQRTHRLHVYIQGENPFTFADRLAAAHRRRSEAEANVRYNLYIENMPRDDFIESCFAFLTKITSSINNFELSSPSMRDVLNECYSEVRASYACSINKLLFEYSRNDPSVAYLFENSDPLPPPSTPLAAPEKGCIDMVEYDKSEISRQFKFHSFITQPKVVEAYKSALIECSKALEIALFNTNINRAHAIDAFVQVQSQARSTALKYLKEQWSVNVRTSIRNCLLEIPHGWFSLHNLTYDVYKFSKLKRFMLMIKLLMEDTLKYFIEQNLTRYVSWLSAAMSPSIIVQSPSEVLILDPVTMESLLGRLFPLFSLDLTVDENLSKILFSTSFDGILNTPLELFDSAIESLFTIEQVENGVLGNLFKYGSDKVPCLSSPTLASPTIANLRETLSKSLKLGLVPLDEYVAAFDKYKEFISLDPAQYLLELEYKCGLKAPPEENSPKTEEPPVLTIDRSVIVAEVKSKLSFAEEILSDISPTVQVGSFMINCNPVRRYLSEKCKKLADMALGLLSVSGRTLAVEIVSEIKNMQSVLMKPPRNVEQLTELRRYTEEVEKKLPLIAKKVSDMTKFYDSLESFNYVSSDSDFKQRWEAFSLPVELEEQISANIPAFDNFENQFKQELDSGKEAFSRQLQSLAVSVASFNSKTDLSQVDSVAAEVKALQRQLKQAEEKVREFNSREQLFGQDQSEYQELSTTIKNFAPFSDLWITAYDWIHGKSAWLSDSWYSLDAETMEKTVSVQFKTINKVSRQLKDVPSCQKIALKIKEDMEEFTPHVPLIVAMRNPGIRDRHWEEISQSIGFNLKPDSDYNLNKFFEMDIPKYSEQILKITSKAQKEYAIERSLDQMQNEWKGLKFFIKEYGTSKTFIMGGAEVIMQQLDDHIVMTQSMSFSPFKGPFEERISKWETLLKQIQSIIEEWVLVQSAWMYLEPIFSSPDIVKQLPQEYKRFQSVDMTWRKILGDANKNPEVVSFCQTPDLYKKFCDSNTLLSQVQKGLSQYLESKRAVFARFYFLSDDDLLKILSQTKDPTAVQPHLKKCFENIHELQFEGEDNLMTAMFSAEKERINFVSAIKPTLLVENWMCDIEQMMRDSVRNQIDLALKAYFEIPRTEWVMQFPGQVVLAVDMIVWTMEVETAIHEGQLRQLTDKLSRQLNDITEIVRGEVSLLGTLTLGALITLDVHARDVTDLLAKANIKTTGDFEWISQLRYYWRPDDKEKHQVFVEMVQTVAPYCYEYLGNTPRLVITPLTDKIYMTLMGAIALHLGGAPAGPAGTGKTETTKDLAKALANQCVVFNCSDGLNYLAMEKFFKGLAQSGAWACFDEFNRIDIEVLSVIAQQLSTIYQAVKERKQRFHFGGIELPLSPTFACFITMNPGYAGRSVLKYFLNFY
ncbi:hypothetical protein RCL1_005083 [Eukaryota sp. TZLM3-RCL]